MNSMNRLAVRETKKIQTDAEATSMGQRVKLLAHFEGMISHERQTGRKYHCSLIGKLFKWFAKIYALKILSRRYIARNDTILVLRKDYKTTKQESNELF